MCFLLLVKLYATHNTSVRISIVHFTVDAVNRHLTVGRNLRCWPSETNPQAKITVILIFDVWRSALQSFTVGNRQELVIYGGKPSAAGQAGPGSTDSGPHEPSWPDFRRTFYIYIANCLWGSRGAESAPWAWAWVGTLSHWVPDAAPLLTISHRQYEFHR